MAVKDKQKQTNINIQEKANLIWEIATHLYGEYKPHEYGKVILPMTVIKRFDDALKDTKKAVVEKNIELNSSNKEVNDKTRHAILKNVATKFTNPVTQINKNIPILRLNTSNTPIDSSKLTILIM